MLIIIQKIHTTCTTPSSSPKHPTHPMWCFLYSNRSDTSHPGLRTAAYIKPKRGYLNVLKTTHILLKLAATEIALYWKWLTFRVNSNAECLCGCV